MAEFTPGSDRPQSELRHSLAFPSLHPKLAPRRSLPEACAAGWANAALRGSRGPPPDSLYPVPSAALVVLPPPFLHSCHGCPPMPGSAPFPPGAPPNSARDQQTPPALWLHGALCAPLAAGSRDSACAPSSLLSLYAPGSGRGSVCTRRGQTEGGDRELQSQRPSCQAQCPGQRFFRRGS